MSMTIKRSQFIDDTWEEKKCALHSSKYSTRYSLMTLIVSEEKKQSVHI
jgi:hypothetical protein